MSEITKISFSKNERIVVLKNIHAERKAVGLPKVSLLSSLIGKTVKFDCYEHKHHHEKLNKEVQLCRVKGADATAGDVSTPAIEFLIPITAIKKHDYQFTEVE